MGASGALMEELTVKDGRVVAGALEEYLLFTMADTPQVETIIVNRPDRKPSGTGEAPIGPIAPAIGNAFFALTGVRLRQLPMTPQRVMAALASRRIDEPANRPDEPSLKELNAPAAGPKAERREETVT